MLEIHPQLHDRPESTFLLELYLYLVIESLDGQTSTLFIFIDESGNFDFSSHGTHHFVMAGIASVEPIESHLKLQSLRYSLMSIGHDIAEFHATEDKQIIRDAVTESMNQMPTIETHVAFGEKIDSELKSKKISEFHFLFSREIIAQLLRKFDSYPIRNVVVVLDKAFTKKIQGDVRAKLKHHLKTHNMSFHIYFQPVKTDTNSQIADYLAWAKFRELERGDSRSWDKISVSLRVTEKRVF